MKQHFSQAEKRFNATSMVKLRTYPDGVGRLEEVAGLFADEAPIALHSSAF